MITAVECPIILCKMQVIQHKQTQPSKCEVIFACLRNLTPLKFQIPKTANEPQEVTRVVHMSFWNPGTSSLLSFPQVDCRILLDEYVLGLEWYLLRPIGNINGINWKRYFWGGSNLEVSVLSLVCLLTKSTVWIRAFFLADRPFTFAKQRKSSMSLCKNSNKLSLSLSAAKVKLGNSVHWGSPSIGTHVTCSQCRNIQIRQLVSGSRGLYVHYA